MYENSTYRIKKSNTDRGMLILAVMNMLQTGVLVLIGKMTIPLLILSFFVSAFGFYFFTKKPMQIHTGEHARFQDNLKRISAGIDPRCANPDCKNLVVATAGVPADELFCELHTQEKCHGCGRPWVGSSPSGLAPDELECDDCVKDSIDTRMTMESSLRQAVLPIN